VLPQAGAATELQKMYRGFAVRKSNKGKPARQSPTLNPTLELFFSVKWLPSPKHGTRDRRFSVYKSNKGKAARQPPNLLHFFFITLEPRVE